MQPPAAKQFNARRGGIRLIAFMPLWVQIIVSLAGPTFFEPMFPYRPTVLGLPLGVVVNGAALIWMLIGVAIVWKPRSTLVDALALVLFTFPATLITITAPAVVLILQNIS